MASHPLEHIIMYAPFGNNLPELKIGGAEKGCRKTLAIYKGHGLKVDCVEKIANTGSIASYAFKTLKTAFRLWSICRKNPDTLVHFVGFYDRVIKIERFIITIITLIGNPVVYEMRNGNLAYCYNNRNESYRRDQRKVWSMSKGLLCQGKEFVDLVRQETGREAFLYPNFIKDKGFDSAHKSLPGQAPQLIFQGRLVQNKNIDLIVKTLALIKKKYGNAHLHLVGAISSDYRKELDELCSKLELPSNSITYHGFRDFDYISDLLKKCHFFVFPSTNPTEGHSNALTEAMGYGVVPIVSPAGFNRSVCGNEFVVENLDEKAYADKILTYLSDNLWQEKSLKVSQRVKQLFTEDQVGKKLLEYLNALKES